MLAGNGTLAAALELGWKDGRRHAGPLRAARTEARAFALADNRTGELAQWNAPVLLEALESLALEGWRLEELGFAPEDLAAWKRRQAPARRRRSSRPTTRTSRPSYLCPQCAYEWGGRPE